MIGAIKGFVTRKIVSIVVDTDPLVDGLTDGIESMLDIVIAVFPLMLVIGMLALVIGYMKFRN